MNYLLALLGEIIQSDWSETIGWVLLHSIWQLALVAALYAIAAFLCRYRSASLRYLFGCAAMVAMLLLPVATYCYFQTSTEITPAIGVPTAEVASVPVTGVQHELDGWPEPSHALSPIPTIEAPLASNVASAKASLLVRMSIAVGPWLPVATLVWIAGVLILLLRPLAGCFHVRKLKRFGQTTLAEPTLLACDKLSKRLGIRRAVKFAQSSLVEVPTVIGYLKPVVLLPVSTITGLSAAELELILAHELAHVRRHDYIVNLAQTVVEALLFYHPGMWWVSSQIRRERENCCDDVVVAISGDRATYIRALAQLEQQRVGPPALAANGGSLMVRVRRLLGQPGSEFSSRSTTAWLAGLVAIALVALTLTTLDGVFAHSNATVDETGELAEFLAGIPEFAQLRIGMTKTRFKETIARHDLDVQTLNDTADSSSYMLRTLTGKTLVVRFNDGKCSGVERKRDQLAWGEPIGGVKIGLQQTQSSVATPETPPRLVPKALHEGDTYFLLSTVQMPECRLKVNNVLYRHPPECLAGAAYQPSTLRTDQVDGIGPTMVLDNQWVSVEDGTPLGLRPGMYQVSYGWAGFYPDKDGGPDNARPVLLWSGSIEVEIEAVKEESNDTASSNPLSWGPKTNEGFQLAIELTNVPANRRWLPGAELTSKLWIKNASSQSQTFSYFVDFWRRHRWYPELQDQKGARFDLPHPYGDEKLQFPKKTLAAGEVLEIGHFAADLHGLPPGRYTCSDTFRISLHNKEVELTGNALDINIGLLDHSESTSRTRPQTRDYSSFPESSQRLHEFRGLREVVTEQDLLEHARTYSLPVEKTGEKYHLWGDAGENVVVTLIDGRVSRIEGLPSDPAKAREAHVQHEAERKKAFTRYDQASQEFAEGAPLNVTSASFLHVGEQAPVAWGSRDRVLELGGLLAGMAKEPEPIPDSGDSLNQKFDRLVWRLRDLAIPAFMVPGKVRVVAYPYPGLNGDKQNPAKEMLRLAQTPEHKRHIVARLIAMLQDRRPTRSWAGSRNGGHFYRNADVALEILDHLAFKERRAMEDLTFFTGSGRDAYLTTADAKTRQEVIARVKAWWRNQPFYKDANKATNGKEATDNNTSRLIIGKERGGQLTQEGIVYTLDFELIQIDQLQELLKHELKTSPGLKLLIHVDPELPNSLGAVAKQLATAAGVLDVQLAKPEDK